METIEKAFGILFILIGLSTPLYLAGRLFWFLTDGLSLLARILWVASALCATLGFLAIGIFNSDIKFLLIISMLSFLYVVIRGIRAFLRLARETQVGSLANHNGSINNRANGSYGHDFFHQDSDLLGKNGLTVGPEGPGIYSGNIRIDRDMNHYDSSRDMNHYDSSSSLSSWDSWSHSFDDH